MRIIEKITVKPGFEDVNIFVIGEASSRLSVPLCKVEVLGKKLCEFNKAIRTE